MPGTLLRLVCSLIAALVLPCSSVEGQNQVEPDSIFFRAVIDGLLVVDVGTQLEISPAPFRIGGEFPGYEPDSSLIEPRVAVLRSIGREPGGQVEVGKCPGILTAQAPTHPACPPNRLTRMEIGLPRAVPRGGVPYWRRAGRQAGMRASVVIRVNFAHLAPHGAYMIDFDYYLDRDEFGWYVVARQPLTIIE